MNNLIDANSVNDYLEKLRKGEIKQGIGIGCELDNHLRYKQGNFNIILGQSNVGKTFWIVWYFLVLSKKGIRFLIFSSENSIEGLYRTLIEFLEGKKIEDLTELEMFTAKANIDSFFKFINTDILYTHRDLLKVFEENKDCFDCAVIDPYNSLIKEKGFGNSHDYDYQAASEIRIFCKTQNKTVYLITHAVTESLRQTYPKDSELAGYPMPPNAAQIEGGGKWVNRADDFIVIHRLTQHPSEWMNTKIHVRKVKDVYTGGKPTFMDEPINFRLKDFRTFLVKPNINSMQEIDILTGDIDVEKPIEPNKDFDISPF